MMINCDLICNENNKRHTKTFRQLRFSLFICTVQGTIVEAQTVLYTVTAECIEDRTEKNFTRDYFTD